MTEAGIADVLFRLLRRMAMPHPFSHGTEPLCGRTKKPRTAKADLSSSESSPIAR
ncbi:hypothetical protein [Prevotella corporis]|uniref:hypothetical protein n=1 Tax=Prevotella corporis TaxID=28128 RepID=UPI0023EFC77D|nr:hypothetical protein [Prevotella corporis]